MSKRHIPNFITKKLNDTNPLSMYFPKDIVFSINEFIEGRKASDLIDPYYIHEICYEIFDEPNEKDIELLCDFFEQIIFEDMNGKKTLVGKDIINATNNGILGDYFQKHFTTSFLNFHQNNV